MGQKDITEKILEAYNDVFADIVNVLVFNGKQVIQENELHDAPARSAYPADGKYREIERDVVKSWQNGNVRIACMGFENQTAIDDKMPFRIIGYDASAYMQQYNDKSIKKCYPVITLVLYFGCKKHWDKPRTLKQCFDIPEGLDPLVNDYKVNLYEIAYLSREQVNMFRSDFRFIADYFVQMRETGKYIGSDGDFLHAQELFGMLTAVADDPRVEEIFNSRQTSERKINNMCDFIDEALAKGKAEGIKEGVQQGMQQGIQQGAHNSNVNTAKNLLEMGMDYAFIAKALKITETEVQQLVQ